MCYLGKAIKTVVVEPVFLPTEEPFNVEEPDTVEVIETEIPVTTTQQQ